ncbi:JAB domain-containing protein [Aerococcaceae bacterium zg-B36]|uniref:JAB domain-containing protein n=1 Tax=Aerococcaceae bacterium zg-252 TaxID=2796928 RepID=UPI001BD882A4|nr:JAB domain-containing protein [Aerococcaceae bacterium zg-B36]
MGNITSLLSKQAQENLKGLSVTEVLNPVVIEKYDLTVADKKKLNTIRKAYQDYAIENITNIKRLDSSEVVKDEFQKYFRHKTQEEMIAIYVDGRMRFVDLKIIYRGGLHQSIAIPRDILQHALVGPVRGVFVAHNHPSGDSTPSDTDIRFTQRLVEACYIMGITLFDHIIIGDGESTSIRELNSKIF